MVELIFIGMVFESFVIGIEIVLLTLILKKYFVKRHELTRLLFIIFLFYSIAIVFSWLSKIIVLYSGLNYIYEGSVSDPGTLESWILFRIIDFRISFVFVTLGIFTSYILKVKVFEDEFNNLHKKIVIIYGLFTLLYSLLIYERANVLYDVFAFLFVLIYMSMIYIPFFSRSLNSYRQTDNKVYKKAFLSLAIMSLSFMMIFVSFLIDRILILLGDPGFSIFYFMAWSFGISALFCAYLGYIRPKAAE